MFASKLANLIRALEATRGSNGWGLLALDERFWALTSQHTKVCDRIRR